MTKTAIRLNFNTHIRAITEVATGAITATSLAANTITAAKIADDAIAAEHIASNALVAASFATGAFDAVLERNISNVEVTAADDSLGSVILAMFHSIVSGGTWTIYQTDDTTIQFTRPVTTDENADPVVRVG